MPIDTTFGHVTHFDDFLGDSFNSFLYTVNADTGGTTEIAEDSNGILRLANDGTNGDINNVFTAELWKPSASGPLIFEARVRASSLSTGIFVGLTDDNDADEVPIDLDTGTLTTTASDAVGFVLDSQETAATWFMCSVKANTDGAQTAATAGPNALAVASTYQTLKVVLNADGDALFFINGKQVGSREACVTTSVALCGAVAQLASGTASNVDVDYIYLCAPRV